MSVLRQAKTLKRSWMVEEIHSRWHWGLLNSYLDLDRRKREEFVVFKELLLTANNLLGCIR